MDSEKGNANCISHRGDPTPTAGTTVRDPVSFRAHLGSARGRLDWRWAVWGEGPGTGFLGSGVSGKTEFDKKTVENEK